MDTLQFYPTPLALAQRCWSKFQNKEVIRLLEPSAGNGDLLAPLLKERERNGIYRREAKSIEVAEIDVTRHARLRELGASVVGVDFLQMENLSQYSHILMNPPFAQGVEHVLHAWDRIFSGEIVAIINAETIRNACTRDRVRLAEIIRKHGDAEIVAEAFLDPDTMRKTDVDVAIVHLTKKPEEGAFRGSFWRHMDTDQENQENIDAGFEMPQHLAIRGNTVVNLVRAFRAAWDARKAAIHAELQATYYSRILGDRLSELNPGSDTLSSLASMKVHKGDLGTLANTMYAEAYDDLKDRAWTSVMYSTEAEKYASTKVREKLASEFENLKKMDFTVPNIYGFLMGLAENQSAIQMDMACEIFDMITQHHSDNTLYYMGWKSNDRHRVGMAIKPKRFILPGFSNNSWYSSLGYNQLQRLRDIDRVFAMLDGKNSPAYGLVDLFEQEFQALKNGKRGVSSYFEVRYYRGVGTIHFYPTNPKLIDRLNQIVGQSRKWLPERREQASKEFWKQHGAAEKITKEAWKRHGGKLQDSTWRLNCRYGHEVEEAAAKMADIIFDVAKLLTDKKVSFRTK